MKFDSHITQQILEFEKKFEETIMSFNKRDESQLRRFWTW